MTQDRSYAARVRFQEERTRALRIQRWAARTLVVGQLVRAGIWGIAWFIVGFAFCYMLYTTGVLTP